MFARVFWCFLFLTIYSSLFAQEKFTVLRDLRSEWMTFDNGTYEPLEEFPFTGLQTIYFQMAPVNQAPAYLRLQSSDKYYLFVNGKVRGEFEGRSEFRIDSLLQTENRKSWIAIHQKRINERDLSTTIITRQKQPLQAESQTKVRPYSPFRDFVVLAGLILTLLFVVSARLNPKLAADYFSISRIIAARDVDDSQASARLTGGSNIQFYVLCSLLIGFYLLIIFHHLPADHELPMRFHASEFWMMWLQWLKLSAAVFLVLLAKIFIIFTLTRLFDMKGIARFHFFNWIRLLLVLLGAATIVLFMYFISRGDGAASYVMFLSLVVVALIIWILLAFFKFSGKTGHSLFHLFSYICATEIIPLLITVKVLFQ